MQFYLKQVAPSPKAKKERGQAALPHIFTYALYVRLLPLEYPLVAAPLALTVKE